jgi:CheY-like chemotaxis protein
MVLIVEDEAISRRALQQLLRMDGMETRAVPSAEEAMAVLAREAPPNVALVDINLPGMDGVEFANRLHRLHPSVPCVFMTANEDAHNERMRSAAGEMTLRKPLDLSRLLDLLHHLPPERHPHCRHHRPS